MSITPIYIALSVIMCTFLALQVVKNRRSRRILIGDNEDQDFLWVSRAHANFVETVPITLIALGAAELAGAPALLLHASGLLLVAGRLLHAYCFLKDHKAMKARVLGMQLTIASMWVSAAAGVIFATMAALN